MLPFWSRTGFGASEVVPVGAAVALGATPPEGSSCGAGAADLEGDPETASCAAMREGAWNSTPQVSAMTRSDRLILLRLVVCMLVASFAQRDEVMPFCKAKNVISEESQLWND